LEGRGGRSLVRSGAKHGRDVEHAGRSLQKLFKKHEAALAKVFNGPDEMNTLRRAHKMLAHLTNLSRRATVGSPALENKQFADSLEATILAATGNAITTGMIMKRVKTVMNLVPGLKEMTMGAKMDKLIGRMWFDPDLAMTLLTRDVKELQGPRWNAALNRLLGAAEFGREDQETSE
jgi:hypothetical protein